MSGDKTDLTRHEKQSADGGALNGRSRNHPPGQSSCDEDTALKGRLDALSSSLSRVDRKRVGHEDTGEDGARGRAMGVGARVLAEFVAAIAVGVFIGWQIDAWMGSQPAGIIVFLALGLAAGFWNLYRISSQQAGPQN